MYYEVADSDAAAVVAALFGDEAGDYRCPCAGLQEEEE